MSMDLPPVIAATQQNQASIISGVVIPGGVECPLLRLPDGRVFALQGMPRGRARVGEELSVRGFPIRISTCQEGDAFLVREIVK